MTIRVREARPHDVDIICEFNRLLAFESEAKELDAAVLRRGVTALLADPVKGRYFLAEEDGAILGQLALTYEYSDWRAGWLWWLQSVYVRHESRRRGVLRTLVQHLIDAARATPHVIGLRLYVETDNVTARATYRALGLNATGYIVMEKHPL